MMFLRVCVPEESSDFVGIEMYKTEKDPMGVLSGKRMKHRGDSSLFGTGIAKYPHEIRFFE